MKTRVWLRIATVFWLLPLQFAAATAPTPGEMREARRWATAKLDAAQETKAIEPPFSFTYDGKPSAELLKTWELKRASRPLDDQRTEYVLTFGDPKTGLVVRCVGIEYRDFPAVEWTLFFKNRSTSDTPIISDIRAMDCGSATGARQAGGRSLCHGQPVPNG